VEITPQCSIGVDETFVSAGVGEIERQISALRHRKPSYSLSREVLPKAFIARHAIDTMYHRKDLR
jgi:hypothetical protein